VNKAILASLLAAAAALVGTEARAADAWGLYTGTTLHGGDNQLSAELGWPDASFQFSHGLTDRFDIGVRLSLMYAYEDEVNVAAGEVGGTFGMGIRAPFRISIVHSDQIGVSFHVDPGIKFYTPPDAVVPFAFQFPLGFEIGIPLTPQATLGLGFDLSMTAYVAPSEFTPFVIAPLFGPAFEYHIDKRIGVGANFRFGPVITLVQSTSFTEFGLVAQGAFIYHL
jgi:hypothetical protein